MAVPGKKLVFVCIGESPDESLGSTTSFPVFRVDMDYGIRAGGHCYRGCMLSEAWRKDSASPMFYVDCQSFFFWYGAFDRLLDIEIIKNRKKSIFKSC